MENERINLIQRFLLELSQGNLALWISTISFFMSLTTWIRVFVTERKRLRFSVQVFQSKGNIAYMSLMIENISRLPIAISQISLCQGGKKINCAPFPKEVITGTKKVDGKIIEKPPKCSAALPIQLAGLSSTSCIVLFEGIPEEILPTSTHLNFEVSSNRGKATKISLPLPAEWADHNDIL